MSKLSMKRRCLWENLPICFVCLKLIENYEECTIEHIIPKSKGGTDQLKNLAVSHQNCNYQRGHSKVKEEWFSKFAKEYERIQRDLKMQTDYPSRKSVIYEMAEEMSRLKIDSDLIAQILQKLL
jgi:5-methylcytosine-specific restriction endonuclease McrA